MTEKRSREFESSWKEVMSKKHKRMYWFNEETGQSSWEKPAIINESEKSPSSKSVNIPNSSEIVVSMKGDHIHRRSESAAKDVIAMESEHVAVQAPSCPRLRSTTSIAGLVHSLRTEKAIIIHGSAENPEVGTVFKLLGQDTSLITRTFQEDQMLKTKLKLSKNGKVIDLPSFWDVWFREDGLLADSVIKAADPNEAKWKGQKRFGYKLATNFIPGYAKAICEHF